MTSTALLSLLSFYDVFLSFFFLCSLSTRRLSLGFELSLSLALHSFIFLLLALSVYTESVLHVYHFDFIHSFGNSHVRTFTFANFNLFIIFSSFQSVIYFHALFRIVQLHLFLFCFRPLIKLSAIYFLFFSVNFSIFLSLSLSCCSCSSLHAFVLVFSQTCFPIFRFRIIWID